LNPNTVSQNSKAEAHCGGHPFEIVFSWHRHGIHLFPPYPDNTYFTLRVTNYIYALAFLEMIRALIRRGVTFVSYELKDVLDYLSGESYFTVNAHAEHFIFYPSEDRRLLKHIEWDKLHMVKWR
jgi:hypothetical protein